MNSHFSLRLATFGLAAMALAAPAAAADTFPVTIEHALGEATISEKPQRILTIGWMAQDSVIALGEVPVGIPYTSWGGDEAGYYPWTKAALDALGEGYPALLNYTDGIPFEDILGLDPDVIIARYSGLTEEEYTRLSSIAPTVAYKGEMWSGEWRDITRTVGKVMGESQRAEELVVETEALLADARAAHPEFEGKTFTFAGGLGAGAAEIAIYVSTDPRVQLMEDLGLVMSPGVKALPTDQGFNIPVSIENLSSVDADIFLAWHPDGAGADYVRTGDVVSRFRPVAEGRFIPIIDRAFVMATSAPSPLSVPYALETVVPAISDVLK